MKSFTLLTIFLVSCLPAGICSPVETPEPEFTPVPRNTFCDIMVSCDVYVYDDYAGVSVPIQGALLEPDSSCDYYNWVTGSNGWAYVVYAHHNFDLDLIISASGYYDTTFTASYSNCPGYVGLIPLTTPEPCINDGDVTLDDALTAADAQQAFLIALGIVLPNYEEECAADCNGDDEVTSADAQLIFIAALEAGMCIDPIFISK